jgi:hypothetical protein
VKAKVTSFRRTKYHLDTAVLLFYWLRLFIMKQQHLVGQDLLTVEASRSHSDTPTLGRIPLNQWSARHRDLYLATHNTHKRQTFLSTARFDPAIPLSQRRHNHALDRAATGIGIIDVDANVNNIGGWRATCVFVDEKECDFEPSGERGRKLSTPSPAPTQLRTSTRNEKSVTIPFFFPQPREVGEK